MGFVLLRVGIWFVSVVYFCNRVICFSGKILVMVEI